MGIVDAMREDARERLLGVAAALVLVAPFGALLLSQPGAGTVALLGAGVAGAVGVFLSIQQREAVGVGTKQKHRDLGQHRFQDGGHGGLFGAWVDAADGEERARRHRVATAVVSFLWALCLGSFGTLVVVSVLVAP